MLLGCSGSSPAPVPPASPPPARVTEGELDEALVLLGEEALAQGRLDAAESHFRRLLAARPELVRAQLGMGRVLLERGDRAGARRNFEAARAAQPDSVVALVGLADVCLQAGDSTAARRYLDAAVQSDPLHGGAHTRRARLTGLSRRPASPSSGQLLELAEAHPYDPWVLVRVGELLASSGREPEAVVYLENAVWLADRDPDSAFRALRLLPRLDESWSRRRVVRVHVYADEAIRAHPGWRFRMRTLWLAASNSLDGVFEIRFVPVSLGGFRAAGSDAGLTSIHAALKETAGPLPAQGIVAGFTARAAPRARGTWKRGVAEFLGRRLTVRLKPGELQSRVLAHELLHIYGGVHVVDDVESLMNPTGRSLKLDRLNLRIVRSLRERTFGPGGVARNVLTHVDLDETIAAYTRALSVNLTFRRIGMAEALEKGQLSRYQAARHSRRATGLDPHLADVSRNVAVFMLAAGRDVDALALLDVAATLYGPRTGPGRETSRQAEALRKALVEKYLD